MADYLKSLSGTAGPCMFYELLHEKPFDESYENFCKTLQFSCDMEKYMEFYAKYIFIGGSHVIHHLKNNKKHLHYCMIYEFLQQKPVRQSYETFCNVIGEGVVEFDEFKNAFDRFARGIFDFDQDLLSPLTSIIEQTLAKSMNKVDLKNRKETPTDDVLKKMNSCVVYEILQRKSCDEAHAAFCKTLNSKCTKTEFQHYYEKFKSMKSEGKGFQLENVIKNDKEAINLCMIYEFQKKKPIGQSYKTFCNTIGKEIVEFDKFKAAFEKFEKEKFALDKMEECSTENSSSFSKFPNEILARIVDNLDLANRLVLRKVSRKLRHVVDDRKMVCDKIELRFTDRFVELHIGSMPQIDYYQRQFECCVVEYNGKKKTIPNSTHMECVMRDLKSFLKNPKFELGELSTVFLMGVSFSFDGFIPFRERPMQKFRDLDAFFGGFGSRLHVKSFDIQFEVHCENNSEPIMSILPHLKPGVLEKIRIRMDFDFSGVMQKVVELPQWKRAKELDMRKVDFELPIQHLLHFKRFAAFFRKITEEEIIEIKEIVSKSNHIDFCSLGFDEDSIDTYWIQRNMGPTEWNDETRAFSFENPETKAVFEIGIFREKIDIIRKT